MCLLLRISREEAENIFGFYYGVKCRQDGETLKIWSDAEGMYLTDYRVELDDADNVESEEFCDFWAFAKLSGVRIRKVREIVIGEQIVEVDIDFLSIFPNLERIVRKNPETVIE